MLNLLMEVRAQLGLTLGLVSHDLGVISRLCKEVIVLKNGVVVKAGYTADGSPTRRTRTRRR